MCERLAIYSAGIMGMFVFVAANSPHITGRIAPDILWSILALSMGIVALVTASSMKLL